MSLFVSSDDYRHQALKSSAGRAWPVASDSSFNIHDWPLVHHSAFNMSDQAPKSSEPEAVAGCHSFTIHHRQTFS
jgi:hypothetical protein